MNPETTSNPSQSNPTPTQVVESTKKCKHMPIIIVLAILAVTGIGFGGFELWQNIQKSSELDDYEEQIAAKDEEISKLNSQKEESDNPTVSPEQQSSSTDYIYVGEWGLKIKKPSDAKNKIKEFSFLNGYPQAADSFVIKEVSASNIANIIIGIGGDKSCDYWVQKPDLCFEINGNNFTVNISSDVSTEIRNFFLDSDNYSAF